MGRKKYTKDQQSQIVNEMLDDFDNQIKDNIKFTIKCKSENQKKLINSIKNNEITICSGPAGSGKTYLSCALALELLKKDHKYKKIVLVKSVTPLKDEELGFLKGDLEDKMRPFMYSFYHNFEKILSKADINLLKANNLIEELPIAYMRGINLDNSIVIIDEIQNITVSNIRTILTRIGYNSKMILLGDTNQIDLRNKRDSCLSFMIQNFKDIDGVDAIELNDEDIVRNPIIKEIENIFKNNRN